VSKTLDAYWENYENCCNELACAITVDDVIRICNHHFDPSAGEAFFPGGGDRDMLGTLTMDNPHGWHTVWVRADYYFAIRDHNGDSFTYTEGDISRGHHRPLS
jgi:hypothetical protein